MCHTNFHLKPLNKLINTSSVSDISESYMQAFRYILQQKCFKRCYIANNVSQSLFSLVTDAMSYLSCAHLKSDFIYIDIYRYLSLFEVIVGPDFHMRIWLYCYLLHQK